MKLLLIIVVVTGSFWSHAQINTPDRFKQLLAPVGVAWSEMRAAISSRTLTHEQKSATLDRLFEALDTACAGNGDAVLDFVQQEKSQRRLQLGQCFGR